MNNTTIDDLRYWAGKAMGWVDYPEDSIERGTVWHQDAKRAPFGRILNKSDWRPDADDKDAATLEAEFLIEVSWGYSDVSATSAMPGYRYPYHVASFEECDGSKKAAKRLAVLMLAAEIGKRKHSQQTGEK